jgi:hypothetical protein
MTKSRSTSMSVRVGTPARINSLRDKLAPAMSSAAFVEFMCDLADVTPKAYHSEAMGKFIRRETARITGKR